MAQKSNHAEPPAPRRTGEFPSSLPPQLVISWLPVSDVASALCASSVWHGESAAVFQIIAQSRGLGRERADVPWSEVVRCSKKRVAVVDPGKRFPHATHFARLLGVEHGWVAVPYSAPPGTGAPDVGYVGDFISEAEYVGPHTGTSRLVMAFRADRDGVIHIIGRAGVLVGYPGELGTVNLTAADVETLGVSDLKKELAARGVAAPTTDPELLRTRLTDELRSSSLWGPGVVY